MARLGNVKVRPDKYFTDPRVRICLNTSCGHNLYRAPEAEANCRLRCIEIDANGKCMQFKEVE